VTAILLDTCLLSEIDRGPPHSGVVAALDQYSMGDLYLSVLSIGELTNGIELLQPSWRKDRYVQRRATILRDFADRILTIDVDTATIWGKLVARARHAGTPVQSPDALIAATAIRHGLQVMTRKVRHFEPTGVTIVNPWTDE
jgi:predicted nucleic acid-binding protein